MINGYNLDIYAQFKALENIIMSNEIINIAIERARRLDIGSYYIGAGCIAQTVWNYLSDCPLKFSLFFYSNW
ncbi:hypothetical protein ACJDU8_11990 [Clostridium sp. WILCCON 0269]|uniref:Uncharacterized protein n=1 Tax=Candidatus Clostridium eludens TaxID=3381663 RepID=A0ABW8SLP8_9CLOT